VTDWRPRGNFNVVHKAIRPFGEISEALTQELELVATDYIRVVSELRPSAGASGTSTRGGLNSADVAQRLSRVQDMAIELANALDDLGPIELAWMWPSSPTLLQSKLLPPRDLSASANALKQEVIVATDQLASAAARLFAGREAAFLGEARKIMKESALMRAFWPEMREAMLRQKRQPRRAPEENLDAQRRLEQLLADTLHGTIRPREDLVRPFVTRLDELSTGVMHAADEIKVRGKAAAGNPSDSSPEIFLTFACCILVGQYFDETKIEDKPSWRAEDRSIFVDLVKAMITYAIGKPVRGGDKAITEGIKRWRETRLAVRTNVPKN
jgi:hypothetical protein